MPRPTATTSTTTTMTTDSGQRQRGILIVGASSGIGHAVASVYARRGWHVGVMARRDEPLRRLSRQYPATVLWQTVDVTAPDCRQLFVDLYRRMPCCDTVLYAAGCGWNNPALDADFDNRTLRTNVDGFTNIANTVYKLSAEAARSGGKGLHLCVITSIAATKGIGVSATYSASKRYQTTYLQALRQLAHAQRNPIKITDIRPGFVDTDLLDTTQRRYPMLMTLRYATRRVVRAVDSRRKTVYVDWRWHLVAALWRLIPPRLWTLIKL